MTTRQLVLAAIVISLVCCGIMWFLEDFRQEKILQAFRAEWSGVPTFNRPADV